MKDAPIMLWRFSFCVVNREGGRGGRTPPCFFSLLGLVGREARGGEGVLEFMRSRIRMSI